MLRRTIAMLLAFMMLPACAFAADAEHILNVALNAVRVVSGAQEDAIAWAETSSDNALLLEIRGAWYLTIHDAQVLLETIEKTYIFDACRADPRETLQLALSVKHGMAEYQEIMVLVENSQLGEFLVTDDNFAEYAGAVEASGYGDVEDSSLARDIVHVLSGGTAAQASPSGGYGWGESAAMPSFLNDYDWDLQVYPWSIPPVDTSSANSSTGLEDYCSHCHNTGRCPECNGSGSFRNPYTGNYIDCSCTGGDCPYC